MLYVLNLSYLSTVYLPILSFIFTLTTCGPRIFYSGTKDLFDLAEVTDFFKEIDIFLT